MYVLKDEIVLSRELSQEFREEKSMYHLWKKGQATQEVFKDVLRSCRKKKIREMKAQLELSLATSVQDNALMNINKRRTKENLHSLLECPSPKTRKRLRYLTPSLPQS